MTKKLLLAGLIALPLALAGLAYGKSLLGSGAAQAPAYICPLTGAELPCEDCCPLNGK